MAALYACRTLEIMLLLVVNSHKHANEFARNLTMMLIQSLQIGD